MKKISIQNIIIGIGIGMMLTSSFNIFYNYKFNTDIKDVTPNNANSIEENEDQPQIIIINDPEEVDDISKNGELYYHHITIKRGMTSDQIAKYLEDEKVIDDPVEFIERVKELNLTNGLHFGDKSIPKGSTIEEILIILSSPN